MKSSKAQDSSKTSAKVKINIYWGDIFYESGLFGKADKFFVGRTVDSQFIIDRDKIKLLDVMDDGSAEIQFDDNIDGHIRFGKELVTLSSAKESSRVQNAGPGVSKVRFSKEDKAELMFEHVTFSIFWVDEPENIAKFAKVPVQKILAYSAALLLFIFVPVILQNTVETPEIEKPPERVVTLMPKKVAKAAAGQMKSATGGAASGEAGKAAPPPPKPPTAAEVLKSSNLGNLINSLSALGKAAPKVNTDSQTNQKEVANLTDQGAKGSTSEGLKQGAGGKSVGIGRTVGQGEGGFEGTGKLGLSGNSLVEGSEGFGDQQYQIEGGLDRDVIDAIIRKRQDKIRLCYERQLNFYPNLAGKIAVQFVIGKSGAVQSASAIEDTMKNASVVSCLLAEVREWNFPPPRGGTLVKIEYPFVFESSAKGR